MKNKQQPYRVKSINEYHELRGLPKAEHPLISVINLEDITLIPEDNFVLDFYFISIKRNANGKIKYGQQEYDFDEGVMFFIAPNQVFGVEVGNSSTPVSGWMLLIHPDFLWNTPLAKNIRHYEYFDYSVNEALFLSPKEELKIIDIIKDINQECMQNIDEFSQKIIISQIEVLLNYAERFYQRQFITRKITNHSILNRLEVILNDYFNGKDLVEKGLPTVQYIADTLHMSPKYLSSLLKSITGQSTQQHIHEKLIEKAKEKLSTTDLSISEIAFELGFEHSQSFCKLFKAKTDVSPKKFRADFN